jgi:endonuclease/exonuclease/phosphatase (EEP) superfamily protein YafD
VRLLPWLAVLPLAALAPDPVLGSADSGLRLMTYNLNYGNPRPETSLAAIEKEDADIVLLQEITSSWRHALDRRLGKQYPHRVYHLYGRSAGGIAVLSKHPISRDELWVPPAGTGAWFPAQRLVVDAASSGIGALQILNVHLRPALKDGSWIKGFLATPPLRRAEIEAHWKKLDPKLPTIVAGDFNEDPWGRAVDFLQQQGLVRVPTTGPTTWHYESSAGTDLLKLDIEHVMIDGRMTARDGRVLEAGTSDHRPVVVTIEPKKTP